MKGLKLGPRPEDTKEYTWQECTCYCHVKGGMHFTNCCVNGWEKVYRPPIFSTITAFNTGILRTSKDVNWDIQWDKDVPNLETPPEKDSADGADNSNNLK